MHYKSQNINIIAFLLTVTDSKIVDVQNSGTGGKVFVLSGSELDYEPLILQYFNGETFQVSPKELFQQIKNLKGLLYDGRQERA